MRRWIIMNERGRERKRRKRVSEQDRGEGERREWIIKWGEECEWVYECVCGSVWAWVSEWVLRQVKQWEKGKHEVRKWEQMKRQKVKKEKKTGKWTNKQSPNKANMNEARARRGEETVERNEDDKRNRKRKRKSVKILWAGRGEVNGGRKMKMK